VEDLLLKHWRDEGWPVTILRPQGVFGVFEAKHAEFVFSRLHHSLPIFRDARDTARLTFLFVDDLVSAFVKAINTGTSHGKTYNVAGDESVNQEEFVALCGEVSSCRTEMRTVSDWRHRYVQIGIPWLGYDLVADNSLIKRELGLIFTPLREALSSTLAWLHTDPDHLTPRSLPAESYLARNRRVPIGRFAAARIQRALAARLRLR
jgi:nucleoside-diphosphate-sugar epimerase